jgi:integrase
LRLTEFFLLSWDEPPVLLDLHGAKYPRIIWHAAGHKSRRDEITPITPEFHRQLKMLSHRNNAGPVFEPPCQARDFSALIKQVAKKAKVFVGSTYASPHDFRRSFATRLAPKVRPVTLRAIMRHADIRTTLQYYVDLDADDVGAELWK